MVSWNKIFGFGSVAGATALLAVVAFRCPLHKSVYFRCIGNGHSTATNSTTAALSTNQTNHTNAYVDLGVLGFCTNLQDGRGLQCSQPKIGYNLSVPASAASQALAVFNFDIFFQIIQKRINAEGNHGTAVVGNAMFFVLVASLLLFIIPLLFLLGRCCGWFMDAHEEEPRDEKRRQMAIPAAPHTSRCKLREFILSRWQEDSSPWSRANTVSNPIIEE
ncbi:hypothetical protein DFH07DRAFT_776669 [Mycena maculata]|uniref:Uncharacterized protein n=1 Tax=Mycena maculata TaxID=230809 RepID=A0AAD7INK8_9AGAR|nr:hypothetical protein DFH07DRAFT_776669 [Mycena maculata]